MTTLTIQEYSGPDGNAVVMVDGATPCALTIRDPFEGTAQDQELEWYFEQHIEMPIYHARAYAAATSIKSYGEVLFEQVVQAQKLREQYEECDKADLTVEIVGSPEFHRYHWEALKDPILAQPFALTGTLVRRSTPRHAVVTQQAARPPTPTINLLVVTARPRGQQDVGYRTISRPLLAQLRQAQLPVQVDILRPGTYTALQAQLQTKGAGYYHAIHFDVHGALLGYNEATYRREQAIPKAQRKGVTHHNRLPLAPYTGYSGFVFLESEVEGRADPIEAGELATLLHYYNVPLVILNACQSGKQVGASETSIGSRLIAAGQQVVLAMGYSVTVTAAVQVMTALYQELFAGRDLAHAIQQARLALYHDKGRRARFNVQLDLEDWLLPVVYENKPLVLDTRAMTSAETGAFESRATYCAHEPTYGFWGRDIDILQIERRLVQHNLLLIQGMAGAGKSTLLHHLGWWWQTTAFVQQIFYFGWDARAWNRQQILHEIAQVLYDKNSFEHHFLPKLGEAQQAMVAETLRSHSHLLILDNLESITSTTPALDRHPLRPEEQTQLYDFLVALVGGQTKVLLGSRGAEEWLTSGENAPLRRGDRLILSGLDAEAASGLADAILTKQGTRHIREQATTRDAFLKLMDFCAGYPLVLEVVLSNLRYQSPNQVLQELMAGNSRIDFNSPQADKTQSLLKCIEYSYNNLSPTAQALLLCLAPFVTVFNLNWSEEYANHLYQQPELASLPFEQWEGVLKEAVAWGLMTPYEHGQQFLSLQPILPYFLQSRMKDVPDILRPAVIQRAYMNFYQDIGRKLCRLLVSSKANESKLGLWLTGLDYGNLLYALELNLQAEQPFDDIYFPLATYYEHTRKQQEALLLGERVLAHLRMWSEEQLTGPMGAEYVSVLDNLAHYYLEAKDYPTATTLYQEALKTHLSLKHLAGDIKQVGSASLYHQLGVIAHEQQQWEEATQFYQQVLELEFHDPYNQGKTYHQLGMIAQEQRQWDEAVQFYQQAIASHVEFHQRYEQADSYHQLGLVAQEQEQWGQARQFYQQALAIRGEFEDRYGQANVYYQLGRVATEIGELGEARQLYQQALVIFIEFNDLRQQAIVYHQLGGVAEEESELKQARQFCQQALDIFIKLNDLHLQATMYHQLGHVMEQEGDYQEAERLYQQALVIFIKFNDRYRQTYTYSQLGLLMQDQEQWSDAKTYHSEELNIGAELQDKERTTYALLNLALLWSRSEDESIVTLVATRMGWSTDDARRVLTKIYQDYKYEE
jgi:tetratricopeptide (TPR) repeat protein